MLHFVKSPSATFVRERNPHFWSLRVSSPLLPSRRVFLASLCSCVEIFCFPCYKPISDIRAISMRSWYARLEHMEMWALVIMLLLFFVLFDHSGIVGLKLPETNIT
jgi:hypothetical protein